MAKITRKSMSIFGASAGVNEISQYGSLAAGSILYTTDPETIQALAQYAEGWFGGVIASNSPAIEDMNALCYLFAYQLAYAMQAGIPEWDDGTTYYIGSLASDGAGKVYTSLTDTNLNNALTSGANWRCISGSNLTTINPATQSPYALSTSKAGDVFLVNTANGAQTFNLPAAVSGLKFTIKDVGNNAFTNNITVARNGSESIENVAANYVLDSNKGAWTFLCDGTNWWLIA